MKLFPLLGVLLFLRCQNHLLSLIPSSLKLFLCVTTLILLTSLDTLDLLSLDLTRLLEHLGHVAVTVDAADLGHVLVPLDQGVVVLEGLSLSGRLDTLSARGVGTPEANVAVIGT